MKSTGIMVREMKALHIQVRNRFDD